MQTDILVFDVGLGQSIFVFPHSHPEYGMMVDCGNTEDFEPVDFLVKQGLIKNGVLSNLTLTNYDQDHFSGMSYLQSKVSIHTVTFAKNLTSLEIKDLKEKPHTQALVEICDVKDRYIHPVPEYQPPFIKRVFHLEKVDLEDHDTNNLSQVVFVESNGSVVCISGDLEEKGWEALIAKQPNIKTWLAKTNIFIASHHGRENGYHPDTFLHCKPECIVISDKGILHETQRDMSSVYSGHVVGVGVFMNGDVINRRKVLTTRDDGHIWLQLHPGGRRIYKNFSHV